MGRPIWCNSSVRLFWRIQKEKKIYSFFVYIIHWGEKKSTNLSKSWCLKGTIYKLTEVLREPFMRKKNSREEELPEKFDVRKISSVMFQIWRKKKEYKRRRKIPPAKFDDLNNMRWGHSLTTWNVFLPYSSTSDRFL